MDSLRSSRMSSLQVTKSIREFKTINGTRKDTELNDDSWYGYGVLQSCERTDNHRLPKLVNSRRTKKERETKSLLKSGNKEGYECVDDAKSQLMKRENGELLSE